MTTYDPDVAPVPAEWLAMDEDARLELVARYHHANAERPPGARLHAAVHVVVENQVALGEAIVLETLARLQREGRSRHDAIHAVGSVLADRLLDALQGRVSKPELASSYLESLKAL